MCVVGDGEQGWGVSEDLWGLAPARVLSTATVFKLWTRPTSKALGNVLQNETQQSKVSKDRTEPRSFEEARGADRCFPGTRL